MAKNTINLLQAELLPKQALLTLKRVVISWGLLLVLMLAVAFFTQYQSNQLTEQQLKQQTIKSNQNSLLSDLEAQLRQNKADSSFSDRLALLKLMMVNKQALHRELTNENSTYVAGFAKAMTDLANMHSNNVSVERVAINYNDMVLSGMARTPEAVPEWLAKFESSTVLSGKVFSHFNLMENDDHFTDFVVSTRNSLEVNN